MHCTLYTNLIILGSTLSTVRYTVLLTKSRTLVKGWAPHCHLCKGWACGHHTVFSVKGGQNTVFSVEGGHYTVFSVEGGHHTVFSVEGGHHATLNPQSNLTETAANDLHTIYLQSQTYSQRQFCTEFCTHKYKKQQRGVLQINNNT